MSKFRIRKSSRSRITPVWIAQCMCGQQKVRLSHESAMAQVDHWWRYAACTPVEDSRERSRRASQKQ